MISLNTSPIPISPFSSVSGSSVDTAAGKGPALRPAADVVKLGAAPTGKPGEAPELREPRGPQRTGELDDMTKAMGIAGVISMLIGMLSQMMLQDSQRVSASSAREVQLAASSANAQRKAGQAELSGGLAQAASMFTTTAVGTMRSMQGSNKQIETTRTNQPKAADSQALARGTVSPRAAETYTTIGTSQTRTHSEMMLKGSKLQSQGDALRAGGSALTKVAEASQGAAVSAHRAEQTVASADASVAGRTTDAELKARSMTDEVMNQMRAIRDRDNQSKSDTASHVAQGTR